jgi:hypothetical protein
MIERQGKQFWLTCDACPEALETDATNFAEANAARKNAGWAARKVGEEWIHLCPACRREQDGR